MLDQLRRLDPQRTWRFAARGLAGLGVVLAAGVGFAILVALVSTEWAPLHALDLGVASRLNELVSARPLVVAALQRLTDLGGSPTSWLLLSTTAAWLLVRRQPRLAVFVLVTGLGAAILGPCVKELVSRARPLVEVPVAAAPGDSFPSGHALGSLVSYGVLLLVFLPAVPRRAHRTVCLAATALVALVGGTRVALGVHYVSDVLGGWLLGVAWLGVTTTAFRRWRGAAGLPRRPLAQGLAPEAAPALAPAPEAGTESLPQAGPVAARLLVVWVLLLGVLVGAGLLVTEVLPGTAADRLEEAVVRWLVGLRSPALNDFSTLASALGGTPLILASTAVVAPLTLAVTRRWRPVLFLVVTMIGEVTLFLAAGEIVDRTRPPVPHLDPTLPPTSSFPSGHVAAAVCWYGALAVLVARRTRARWRWAVVALTVTAAALTAWSRVYRGVHFPTDVLGSLLLALPWLATTWHLLRPDAER